jgi:hypothetical protein
MTDRIAVPNGIRAKTGLSVAPSSTLLSGANRTLKPLHSYVAGLRLFSEKDHLGVLGGVDPENLAQAGWGVIFPEVSDHNIQKALDPLLRLRKEQTNGLFKVFDGAEGYIKNDTANAWLARPPRRLRMESVDPSRGVPFYLLLVGSPEQIPFEFQFDLDLFWAVGRMHFQEDDGYTQYAKSIVRYETSCAKSRAREVTIWCTDHDDKESNEGEGAASLFKRQVACPLAFGTDSRAPLGQGQDFKVHSIIGRDATKKNLLAELSGDSGHAPAVLFTGSHGAEFDPDDSDLEHLQGALVCQDWESGEVSPEQMLAAADITPDAHIHGLIFFCFACFSAGWTEFLDVGSSRIRLASKPGISKLAEALLSHPTGGALAFLGHVNRAWSYSFDTGEGPQTQGFEDVLQRLMMGQRIGQATDQFTMRWAGLATRILALTPKAYHSREANEELSVVWAAYDDARNYIVIGDPAVKLANLESCKGRDSASASSTAERTP